MTWLHLFLVLSLAVSAFTTASNYQNTPSVTGDGFRMPAGGGAVSNKLNDVVQKPTGVFASSSITQQQAHAPDIEMQEVVAMENVRNDIVVRTRRKERWSFSHNLVDSFSFLTEGPSQGSVPFFRHWRWAQSIGRSSREPVSTSFSRKYV